MTEKDKKKHSLRFIVLLGIVSLFADMTYEGARSILGPFLGVLGATGVVVGTVSGLGEGVGYGLRLLCGYVSDRTKHYWMLTFVGYLLTLTAIPLLAFAKNWHTVALLIILERAGKAIRQPSRDALLSYAASNIGQGKGFGIHEALDQIGAVTGPLLLAGVLALTGSYIWGFGLLSIPSLCALGVLITAYLLYPTPHHLQKNEIHYQTKRFPKKYWIYLCGVCCVAVGYVDFPLIAYHFQKTHLFSSEWIPLLYAFAMAVDAPAALLCGRLFDKWGLAVLAVVTFVSAFFVIFVFQDSVALAVIGVVLWGVGIGAQESILRSAVALWIAPEKRGMAYGILNTAFGVTWMLGSASIGALYDVSMGALMAFSLCFQLLAIPFLWRVRNMN